MLEFGGLSWEWHPIQANEKYLKWLEDNVEVRPHARSPETHWWFPLRRLGSFPRSPTEHQQESIDIGKLPVVISNEVCEPVFSLFFCVVRLGFGMRKVERAGIAHLERETPKGFRCLTCTRPFQPRPNFEES